MALLEAYEDDEYLPEYGTLVVRDRYDPEGLEPLGNELLAEFATDALSGTVATAGDGWVHGHAGDPFQAVRLEAHDAPPSFVLDEWEDVVETPFHSRSGRIALGYLTGGEDDAGLELGRRGLFRARVARRAAVDGEEGDVWLMQFWPSADPGLPRWVRRTRPAMSAPGSGWHEVLGYAVMDVAWRAAGYGPPRPDGWLDESLQGDPPDAAICAQLGVERPESQRDAVALLVAAGVLVSEGDGYRLAEPQPRAAERLDLPDLLAARVGQAADRTRFTWAAADLASVAAWGGPALSGDLAERLLVAPGDLPALLAHATATGLVQQVEGGIAVLPRRVPEPVVVPAAVVRPPRAANPVTFAGAPPRAGVVGGNGDVVVWHPDGPVVLGHVPHRYRYHACETVAGIAVTTSGGPGTLVRLDGTAEPLPADLGIRPVRSADGRFLAGVEHHVGRRSWDRPHLLDVTTGEVASLPESDGLTRRAIAVLDGALYYSEGTHAGSRTYRWRPGSEPEPLGPDVRQIDPLSGAALERGAGGGFLHTPAGDRIAIPLDRQYELAPGGEVLFAFDYPAHSAWLLDVGTDAPQEHPLPEGCDLSTAVPAAPFWETPSTVVFQQERGGRTRLVRWHVRAGRFDHHDLPDLVGYRPFAVRPILRE
ncbi:hypothetical protein QRX60_30150 [Amycolatopsis mongoliensis]|uniref:Uncharacterized protein n=1 Tax=Amycolatopsis mongoliensis TaxID=715475 RepID=A0A9Y2NHL4_9PSEU|nr:hypothetical protein [Amycolatopsis sp. 4-36]WIX98319.1 hypothetical protein QRX60_30150 [Amycolatopsis sp. 4-36]